MLSYCTCKYCTYVYFMNCSNKLEENCNFYLVSSEKGPMHGHIDHPRAVSIEINKL